MNIFSRVILATALTVVHTTGKIIQKSFKKSCVTFYVRAWEMLRLNMNGVLHASTAKRMNCIFRSDGESLRRA